MYCWVVGSEGDLTDVFFSHMSVISELSVHATGIVMAHGDTVKLSQCIIDLVRVTLRL